MSDMQRFTPGELDALREVVNIGAGHAATALSGLTKRRIMIHVPRVESVTADGMAGFLSVSDEDELVMSTMQLLGMISGNVSLVFQQERALRFSDLLLGRSPGSGAAFDKMEQSSFNEAANIIGSSFLNALAELLEVSLLPSIPSFTLGVAQDLVIEARRDRVDTEDTVICAETEFAFADVDDQFKGYLVLFPAAGSLESILDALKKWIPNE